jgi:RHS repeat-associated protein
VQAGGVKLAYDGDGNRVSETVGGVTTKYLVADQNLTGYAQVLDELKNGAVSRTYSYGLSLISQRLTANGQGLSFYGFDGHGSVRFLTSATGAVTDTYDYDAFGNLISQTGTTPNNYLFASEQFDPALGVYYNRARYYDQRQGRFWTMDTYEGDPESPGSLHKYLYASANPANRGDRTGNLDFSLGSLLTSFSIEAILVRASVGATLGAIDAALAHQSVAGGALQGAVVAAIAPVIPGKVFFYLGIYGIFDALRNAQYGAAAFRIALLGFGIFAQTRSFKSFSTFKEVFGEAGQGKAWHHIVEQSQQAKFGPEAINNPQNIAAVEEGAGSVHRRITGFYNSKQPTITGSEDLTVRQWLSAKSFEEQYQFGLWALNYFGGGGQINIPGITNSWAVPAALRPFEDGPEGDD